MNNKTTDVNDVIINMLMKIYVMLKANEHRLNDIFGPIRHETLQAIRDEALNEFESMLKSLSSGKGKK